ncbi:Crp/Fnr family transcriptional regulator [Aerosakkonema sp. BLCC-F183]|uniref:Crp/Fnr family transcriptional regulator n=1 Tax=Aerosakkonema sp. BLCC-F183 TaxID=3342834 RepID=UPI0035BB41FD
MNIENLLTQLLILKGLSKQQRQKILEIGEIQQYQYGEHIFDEGTENHALYIVLEGKVDIFIDPAFQANVEKGTIKLQKVAEQIEGTSFGEISLIDQFPSSESAICVSKNVKILQISQESFTKLSQEHPEIGYQIFQNIGTNLYNKIRERNALIARQILDNYYLYFLCEEIYAESHKSDGIIPLEKKLIIRDRAHFILSGSQRILDVSPEKEDIDLMLFSTPDVLQNLLKAGTPSGEIVLNTLFFQIGNSCLDKEVPINLFEIIYNPDSLGRSGSLVVHKQYDSQKQTFFVHWEVKGVHYDQASSTTMANIFIYVSDDKSSVNKHIKDLISSINMPIQQHVYDNLPEKSSLQQRNPYHLLVIHHRTHEVVMTLQTLGALGFHIDTFIGIPYGESNWPTMRMLDYVSGQTYRCLRMIQHPIEPTRYEFDFKQSSFLQNADEKLFTTLYDESTANGDYMVAMTTLVETELVRSIQRCMQEKTKLLIYEDGGYAIPLIYQIYQDSTHRLHSLIEQAIDEKIITGAVEVTVTGERRDLAAIESFEGKALLPVLSTARDDLKTIFEAKGVSQAIIDSTSTALGRLGLPTFETRKVAVIGGNGAIGTRLVEELTEMQNSTSNVFAIDIVDRAFSREIDGQRFPYAATKVDYLNLGRYLVEDTCLPVIVDLPFGQHNIQLSYENIEKLVLEFLSSSSKHESFNELVITNSFPSPESPLQMLWEQINKLNLLWESICQQSGYVPEKIELLPNRQGMSQFFSKQNCSKKVTLLVTEQILSFKKVTRLIQNHIDTIIGITGLPVVDEQDINAFFSRKHSGGNVDELVLVSGSSKDYEFKKAITFLNELLEILSEKTIDTDQQLTWYKRYYQQKLCLILDSDRGVVEQVLSSVGTPDAMIEKLKQYPEFIQKIGLNDVQADRWADCLAKCIRYKIKDNLSIRKSLHQDIGTIYHIRFQNHSKRLVLLAHGFVINFFAKHEKGVKTEYIDPIVTMQLLGLIKLATTEKAIEPGVYRMAQHLKTDDMDLFWKALDDKSRPIKF